MQSFPSTEKHNRRSHTKSRTGCTNCKRRKVKCDEVFPACFHCRRHNISCSLSQSKSPLEASDEVPNAPQPATSLRLPYQPSLACNGGISLGTPLPPLAPGFLTQITPLPPDVLWCRGFELMHHYCTATADTLSLRQDMTYVWRSAVPREGYKHSFVIHGILALAAAHKAYLIPSSCELYLKLCDYHSMVGSEGFRSELRKDAQDTWAALFSFASLLVLYAFTLPIRSLDQKLADPLGSLLELASLIRGIKTTLSPLVPRIYRTEFAPLVYGVWPAETNGPLPGYPTLDNTFLPQDLWNAMLQLRTFLNEETPAQGRSRYLEAVDDLEYSARLIALAGTCVESGAVIAWIYRIDERVLVDIGAREPYALVILTYFCVFLSGIQRSFWYVRGWTKCIFHEVEASLMDHPHLLQLLEWPRRCLMIS